MGLDGGHCLGEVPLALTLLKRPIAFWESAVDRLIAAVRSIDAELTMAKPQISDLCLARATVTCATEDA